MTHPLRCLPQIIPTLQAAMTDSHMKVAASGEEATASTAAIGEIDDEMGEPESLSKQKVLLVNTLFLLFLMCKYNYIMSDFNLKCTNFMK